MEKKYKRIPFDLELAKAITKGEKEGRVMSGSYPVRIICWDAKDKGFPIVGLVDEGRCEILRTYKNNGSFSYSTRENGLDLFLEVPDGHEFEEGDLVFQSQELCSWLSLLKSDVEKGGEIFTCDYVNLYLTGGNKGVIEYDTYSNAAEEIRLATPEERQLLIDALKKDNSKKAREYLKRFFGIDAKPKFNDKDWVLIRSIKTEKWDLSRFGYYSGIEEYPYSVLNGNLTKYCIPYNEQTKHLLGTTDDWEG